jgi:chromosome segregation ATPase
MNARSRYLFALLALPLAVHAADSRAPAGASANNSGNLMVQRMLQQTTAERDQLAAQVAELEKKLADEAKQRSLVEKKLAAKDASLDKFKDANSNMSDLLETMKTRLQELVDKYREVAQQLRDTEQAKASVEMDLAQREAELAHHIENNAKLVVLGEEILAQYEDKGVWDALFQQEPLTQLKRAEIESIREQYRVAIEQLKVAQEEAARLANR